MAQLSTLGGSLYFYMKACGYCGRKNEETAEHCSECATPFVADAPDTPKILTRTVESGLRLALLNGFGILLILLALFFTIGRLYAEYRMPPQQMPSYVAYSVFSSTAPAPFIVLVAAVPIFFVCRARSRQRRSGIITAVVIIGIAAVVIVLAKIMPMIVMFWCWPALLIGSATRSSFGFYIGALLQIVIGAWLVIWFHPHKSPDEKDAA